MDTEVSRLEPHQPLPRTGELLPRTPNTILFNEGHFLDLARRLGLIKTDNDVTKQITNTQANQYRPAIIASEKAIPYTKLTIDFQPTPIEREVALRNMPPTTERYKALSEGRPNLKNFYEIDNDWIVQKAEESPANLDKILSLLTIQLDSMPILSDLSGIKEIMGGYERAQDLKAKTRLLNIITTRLEEAEQKLEPVAIQMESIWTIIQQLDQFLKGAGSMINPATQQIAATAQKSLTEQIQHLQKMHDFIPELKKWVASLTSDPDSSFPEQS